jgi:hypothetical protein
MNRLGREPGHRTTRQLLWSAVDSLHHAQGDGTNPREQIALALADLEVLDTRLRDLATMFDRLWD